MTALETPKTEAVTPLNKEFTPYSCTIDLIIIVILSVGYCFPSGRKA